MTRREGPEAEAEVGEKYKIRGEGRKVKGEARKRKGKPPLEDGRWAKTQRKTGKLNADLRGQPPGQRNRSRELIETAWEKARL